MAQLFISYAREDGSETADALANRLRALGHDVFLDVDSITGGTEWQPEISRRVKWSDLVIVLVTEKSNNSDHVYQEIEEAKRLGKTIFPIQINDTPLPVHLRGTWQAVKLKGDRLDSVLLEIERTLRQLQRGKIFRIAKVVGVMVAVVVIVILVVLLLAEDDSGETTQTLTSVAPAPASTALLILDNDCVELEELSGKIGPGSLERTYVPDDPERGCMVRLAYEMADTGWVAFFITLQDADLTPYSTLTFDIKADNPPDQWQMKVEMKRAGFQEISKAYVSGITGDWQPVRVLLSAFEDTGVTAPLSSFTNMEELVFVFEQDRSGETGIICLDNIAFIP